MLPEKAALFFFGAEKFALKYDVRSNTNLYNVECIGVGRRQNLWDWAVPFITLSKKRPVLFARASAKNMQTGFVN